MYDISITHNIDANTRIDHLLLCLRVAILYHSCDYCNNPISLNQRTVLIGGTSWWYYVYVQHCKSKCIIMFMCIVSKALS